MADNLTKANLASVAVHELFHRALNVDPKLKAAVDRFAEQRRQRFDDAAQGKGSKEDIAAYRRVIDSKTEAMDQLEEFMAYQISAWETQPETLSEGLRKLIGDFIAAIKAALMRMGFYDPKTLTPALLSALAKQAGGVSQNSKNSGNSSSDLSFSTNTPEYKRQYKDIERQFWDENGNEKPGAMLAPNGDKSKLNKTQWIQVRTQAFKDWFGDWEAAAAINELTSGDPIIVKGDEFYDFSEPVDMDAARAKAEEYANNTVIGNYRNLNSGLNLEIRESGVEQALSHGGAPDKLKAFAAVPDIVREGYVVYDGVNPKNTRNRLVAISKKVDISGKSYVVTAGFREDANGRLFYDHELFDVSRADGFISQRGEGIASQQPLGTSTRLNDYYRRFVAQKVQHSKVTDANGEPMVVYHSTKSDFDTFKLKGMSKGFFFTDDPDVAMHPKLGDTENPYQTGSNLMPVFLDIKNNSNIGANRNPYFENHFIQDAKADGKDGLINKKEGLYVAFNPNQIKSATGNTGAFSREDNDIRYSKSGNIKYSKAAKPDILAEAKRKAGFVPKKTLSQTIQGILNKGVSANAQAIKDYLAEIKQILEQGVFDKFIGIKRAEAAVLGNVAHSQSGYIGARLSTGSSSTMAAVLQFGAPELKDGIIQMKAGSKGLAEILKPVKADLENFTAWMVGRRAKRLFGEGKEHNFNEAEIEALLALEKPEYQAVADDIAAMNSAILDLAQAAGLVDKDARKLFENNDYIPFYRLKEDGKTGGPFKKRGLSHQSSGIKALKGGDNPLSDPIGNMMQNWAHLIDAAMKNNALDKTLTNLEGSDFIEKQMRVEFEKVFIGKDQIKKSLRDSGVPEDIIDAMPRTPSMASKSCGPCERRPARSCQRDGRSIGYCPSH